MIKSSLVCFFQKKKTILCLLAFLQIFTVNSQDIGFVVPDSLKGKSSEYVFEGFKKVTNDTINSKIYLNTYYKKSILEGDELKKAIALSYLSYYLENNSAKLELLELSIHHAKNASNENYLMILYSLVGGHYQIESNYNKALDYFFRSLQIAEKLESENYIYILKHNIALLKGDTGKFKESLNLFKECYKREESLFTNKMNLYDYLATSLYLSEAFMRNEKIDSASIYINIGLKETKDTLSNLYWKFLLNKGIYLNKKGKNSKSIKYIDSSILGMNKKRIDVKRSLTIAYYYQSINYIQTNELKYLYYFKKLDSIVLKDSILIPEVRKGYENIVRYYKGKNNIEKQIRYINSLISFDSIFNKKKDIVRDRLYKEYETPELIAQKEVLISKLNNDNRKLSVGAILLLLLSIFIAVIAIFQFKKRVSYKHRFNEIMQPSTTIEVAFPVVEIQDKEKQLDISEKVIKDILEKLNSFEEQKQYIKKNINSTTLAKKIGTNKKYLSQIINYYKKKTITNYINELRISFCIEELKSNRKLINYTIQNIAEEVGFNNAESFSKAFYKKTGLKPSYFIKNLKTK